MPTPTKVMYGKNLVDGFDLEILEKEEMPLVYKLEDGTTLEARLIVKKISRVDGKTIGEKGPAYKLDYNLSITTKNIPLDLFETGD